MMGKAVRLSVLVGTYNRLNLLRICLDALIEKIDCKHEIIVVDAGSSDGTLEYLESLDKVSVVTQGKLLGQAKSLNQVIQSLQSDYLCWLSDDNVVRNGILDVAVKILDNNPDIGLVALKVKDVSGEYIEYPYLGSIWPSGVLNCNQGVLPTELMKKLGGFDEHFRDYGIDADLTTRILLSGYKAVYTKRIAIFHHRDHEAENWIDHAGRKSRLDEARIMYQRKFDQLVQLMASENAPKDFPGNGARFLGFSFAVIQARLGKMMMKSIHSRLFFARWLASIARDLENSRKGKYISKLDLPANFFKPYYLVQQIPDEIRSKVA